MGRCGTCDSFEKEYYWDDYGYCNYYGRKVGVNDSWGCYSGSEDYDKDDIFNEDNDDSGCYLTTLMCEILGYEDDCFELTFLRSFRKNYMQTTTEGKKLLSQYKEISRPIVKKLRLRSDRKDIALKMKDDYITLAIEAIENGKPEDGITIYKNMVSYLQSL